MCNAPRGRMGGSEITENCAMWREEEWAEVRWRKNVQCAARKNGRK